MKTKKAILGLALFAALMAITVPTVAHADAFALNFTNSGSFFTDRTPITVGWQFQVVQPVMVYALAEYWDSMFTDGSHAVGIWDLSDNALLVSAAVTSGDPQSGFWRYHSIAPITLPVGTYMIGGATVDDHWSFSPIGQTTISNIVFQNGYNTFGAGLLQPTIPDFPVNSHFGPNFLVTPEPGSLCLLGSGFLCLAGVLRRKLLP